jgi:hypothetical protein
MLLCAVRSLVRLRLFSKFGCNTHLSRGNSDQPIGLPEPRADHAVAMSRFALACLQKMKVLVSQLEVTLGKASEGLLPKLRYRMLTLCLV